MSQQTSERLRRILGSDLTVSELALFVQYETLRDAAQQLITEWEMLEDGYSLKPAVDTLRSALLIPSEEHR